MAQPLVASTFSGGRLSTTAADLHVRNVSKKLAKISPNNNPFLALTSHMTEAVMGSAQKLEWGILGDEARFFTLTAEEAADGVTLAGDTTGLQAGYKLFDPITGEQMPIISVDSSTALTVGARGSYGYHNAPRILPVGTKLLVMNYSVREGQAAATAKGVYPTTLYNYVEQFERVWGASDRQLAIEDYFDGGKATEDERHAMDMYNRERELARLFGRRHEGTLGSGFSSANKAFFMGGLEEFVQTNSENYIDAGGAFDYNFLSREVMPKCITHGQSGEKWGICSLNVMNIIGMFPAAYWQADFMKTKEFGLEVSRVKGQGWVLNLVRSQALEDHEFLATKLIICDPKFITPKVPTRLSQTMNPNIQGGKKDGHHTFLNQVTGGETMEFSIPGANCVVNGIS